MLRRLIEFSLSQRMLVLVLAALLAGAAAAGGIGLINAIGNLGGFVAPNLRAWLDVAFAPGAGLIGLGIVNMIGASLFSIAPRKQ